MQSRAQQRSNESVVELSDFDAEALCARIPFLRGGTARFAGLRPEVKLDALRSKRPLPEIGAARLLTTVPETPARGQPFAIRIGLPKRARVELVRLEIGMPSGATTTTELRPSASDCRRGFVELRGVLSQCAGELYLDVRLYFADGATRSDARLVPVFSRNPGRLTVLPSWLLGSGKTVPFGKIVDGSFGSYIEMVLHLSNGGSTAITYRKYTVRYLDQTTGVTVQVDSNALPKIVVVKPNDWEQPRLKIRVPSGPVIRLIEERHEVAVEITCHADDGSKVTDWALYRRMGTIPINLGVCMSVPAITLFPWRLMVEAAAQASREWEEYGLALDTRFHAVFDGNEPNFPPSFAVINIGFHSPQPGLPQGGLDSSEFLWLCQHCSLPEQKRIDAFVAQLNFSSDVPAEQRAAGLSPLPGPFPKDAPAPPAKYPDAQGSGILVELLLDNPSRLGRILAHEIGHYLGLDHVRIDHNLMTFNANSPALQYWQWAVASKHPMVRYSPIRDVSFSAAVAGIANMLGGDRKNADHLPSKRESGRFSPMLKARLKLEALATRCCSAGDSVERSTFGSAAERSVLLKMLQESDSPDSASLRLFATRALGELGERRAALYMRRTAVDAAEYTHLRLESLRCLFGLNVELSAEELRQLGRDADPAIAIAAIGGALSSEHASMSAWGAKHLARVRDVALRRAILGAAQPRTTRAAPAVREQPVKMDAASVSDAKRPR